MQGSCGVRWLAPLSGLLVAAGLTFTLGPRVAGHARAVKREQTTAYALWRHEGKEGSITWAAQFLAVDGPDRGGAAFFLFVRTSPAPELLIAIVRLTADETSSVSKDGAFLRKHDVPALDLAGGRPVACSLMTAIRPGSAQGVLCGTTLYDTDALAAGVHSRARVDLDRTLFP